MARAAEKSISQIHVNSGTHAAVFGASSFVEDYPASNLDDNSNNSYWKASITDKVFPIEIAIAYNMPIRVYSYMMAGASGQLLAAPTFWRVIGKRAEQGRGDNEVLLDERIVRDLTLSSKPNHFCIYPATHGTKIEKIKLVIFSAETSDDKYNVALRRFFMTTHEEEEQSLGKCID